ncbi:transposase [Bradyrhizobium sp. 155]|uniref:transposase n=1 Tax=Bradyrhizobium sp. 155 TaxID=2782629 RepID=UPI001FFF8F85|nr:transposase [Bradyrhizobium sp. 155]
MTLTNERLQRSVIEAALAVRATRSRANEDKRGQFELALEQARYEVGRARRQYDAVDADNRLVAAELEKRWNERLTVVRNLETELEGLTASPAVDLTPADRERLMTLGADLERAWSSAGVLPGTRKRIVRTLIDEIVVRVEDRSGDPLARRRPLHSQGQEESLRPAPLERSGRNSRSRARAGAADARQSDRVGAQPIRQDHGARQWLDQVASVQLA